MADPVAGLREMARVTRPGGVIAACVWDHAGGGSPLAVFWRAAREIDPLVRDESALPGARDIESAVLTVRVRFPSFGEWWEPYTLGVGPAGDYVRGLDVERRTELRERCAARLPREGPIEIVASAWAASGRPQAIFPGL